MISFSLQLINFHTFCFQCFIENDSTCKNLFSKEIDTLRSTESKKSLEMGKYSLIQSSPRYENFIDASKILLRHEINTSASFSVWIAPQPAFSLSNYFIFKFTTHVRENFFLTKQRIKLWNWQGKKVRVQTREKLFYWVLRSRFASAFIIQSLLL